MQIPPRQPISFRLRLVDDGPAIRIIIPVRTAPRATARNRIRRRIREALRTMGIQVPPGHQAAFTVHGTDLPASDGLKELLVLIIKKSVIVHR